ncbi:MAG TPA: preprotein translocase subunit YajC [Euzebya sp.]|nr:preprotein translocase subunit YajC [Euzebya sp.]
MAITAAITNTIVLAETGAESSTSPLVQLLPFLLIGLVFYFLIIRPQRKRQADQKALLRKLDIGDEIVTIGGFYGEIVALTDETVDIEIAADVVVTLARSAIARTINVAPVMDDEGFEDTSFDDSSFDETLSDAADDPARDDATFDDDLEVDAVPDDARDLDAGDDGRDGR